MPYNKVDGGTAIVAIADTQIGKRYSEEGLPGSDDDGHYWHPGEPYPDAYDCSGFCHFATACVGCPIVEGNAQSQWEDALGGRVAANEDLLPGDIGSFMGVENTPGYAGHTGIVQSYDSATRTGVLVNAYDTAMGVCLIPFDRDQTTNGTNGLGVVGFYRPANSLGAAPVIPKPLALEADMIWLDKDPNNGDAVLIVPSAGGWFGLGSAEATYYSNNGVPQAKKNITKAVFTSLKKLG